jgi:hypothetical protein
VDFKRVVACGDMHCGHRVGLTPPKYQSQRHGDYYFRVQKELHSYFKSSIEKIKPIDILIHNGDGIDGKGFRSGGTELIESDRTKQVDMAVENLLLAEAKHYVLTYGTPYHVGKEDDWEGMIATRLKDKGYDATIESQAWISVNDVVFDIKHKVGSSTVPYGRSTPQKKEQTWNLIWADIGEQPRSDIFLRSHVHYFDFSGNATYLAMTLPALQGQGAKFGERQCTGVVDFGFVYFDIYKNGKIDFEQCILHAESQKREARIL